jgi:predicted extracellular nuclease
MVSLDSTLVALILLMKPGRLTRKPLVALFESVAFGEQVFAVDIHMSSKRGSRSLHGNPRPLVNWVVEKRIAQVKLLAVSEPLIDLLGWF